MSTVFLVLSPDADSGKPDREFRRRAVALSAGRADIREFGTGAEIFDIISGYENIERLIVFAHGAAQGFGWFKRGTGGGIHITRRRGGWKRMEDFARIVGSRLRPNSVVGLAACLCGLSPGEQRGRPKREGESLSDYTLRTKLAPRGRDGAAFKLRDGLLQYVSGVEVRAHVTAGHTTQNPNIISFLPPSGSNGLILANSSFEGESNLLTSYRQWRNDWRGEEAEKWIIGGTLPAGIEGSARIVSRSTSVIPSPGGTISSGSPVVAPQDSRSYAELLAQRGAISTIGSYQDLISPVDEWGDRISLEIDPV